MKRYHMHPFTNRGGEMDIKPEPAEHGEWARYDDVRKLYYGLLGVLEHHFREEEEELVELRKRVADELGAL